MKKTTLVSIRLAFASEIQNIRTWNGKHTRHVDAGSGHKRPEASVSDVYSVDDELAPVGRSDKCSRRLDIGEKDDCRGDLSDI